MIIDTHCHLAFPDFTEDLPEVLQRAHELRVKQVVNISCGGDDIERTLEIAEKNEGIFAAVGLHPNHVHHTEMKKYKAAITQAAEHSKVVAIGETGLDFFHKENPNKEEQEEAFLWHIDLAKETKKAIIIHLRDAKEEARAFLKEHHDFPFVVHCYTEDLAFAEEIFAYGGHVGLGGIITFKNCHPSLLNVAKNAPLDRILLETDAPYLAPVPKRGNRNEPGFTRYVAEFLADLRGISLEEVEEVTTENAKKLFQI